MANHSKATTIPGKPVIEVAGKATELPATSGMVSASTGLKGVESIVGRAALFGGSLKKVYADAQQVAGKAISDVLKDSTGADVHTFADASEHLKQAAKQAYAPFDAYYKEAIGQSLQDVLNNKEFIETAGGPSVAAQVVDAAGQNSIASLKMIRDRLYQTAERLRNAERGTVANQMFQLAAKADSDIQGMVSKMPPEIQAAYNQGQALWRQHRAMDDMREVFAGATTPAEQPKNGMQALQSRISGQKLSAEFNSDLQASRDNVARLTQAVGPKNAQTVQQIATYLAKLPEGGARGMGARLLDTSTISAGVAAPFTGVTPHVVGLALGVKGLAKVLSYPGGATVARIFLEAPVKSARYQFSLMVMGKMINQGETPAAPVQSQPQQPAPIAAQPPVPVSGGATVGEQLKAKFLALPQATQNTPALPFRPGAGVPR